VIDDLQKTVARTDVALLDSCSPIDGNVVPGGAMANDQSLAQKRIQVVSFREG
jgi:hypothetical protein